MREICQSASMSWKSWAKLRTCEIRLRNSMKAKIFGKFSLRKIFLAFRKFILLRCCFSGVGEKSENSQRASICNEEDFLRVNWWKFSNSYLLVSKIDKLSHFQVSWLKIYFQYFLCKLVNFMLENRFEVALAKFSIPNYQENRVEIRMKLNCVSIFWKQQQIQRKSTITSAISLNVKSSLHFFFLFFLILLSTTS